MKKYMSDRKISMIKFYKNLFLFFFISLSLYAYAENSPVLVEFPQTKWYSTDADGKPQIHLYFFWSKTCPHCHRALPLIPKLAESYPWLKLHAFEITENRKNLRRFFRIAKSIGQRPEVVPGFLFCKEMMVGYGTEKTTGAKLKEKLEACYQQRLQRHPR